MLLVLVAVSTWPPSLPFAIGAGVLAGHFVPMCPTVAVWIKAGFPCCAIEWFVSVRVAGCCCLSHLFGQHSVGGECLLELFCEGFDRCCQLLIGTGQLCDTVLIIGSCER